MTAERFDDHAGACRIAAKLPGPESINDVKQSLGLSRENLNSILSIDDYDKFVGKINNVLSDRTQLNFTFAGLDGARSSLQRVADLIDRLRSIKETHPPTASLDKANLRFKTALADDLNISAALAALFDLIREGNRLLADGCGAEGASALATTLERMDAVLALLPGASELPSGAAELLAERIAARTASTSETGAEPYSRPQARSTLSKRRKVPP